MLTRTWFHTGAFTEAPAVTRQYQSEYWIEPALLTTGSAAERAGRNANPRHSDPRRHGRPFEVQEAYRALKAQALRVEVYADDAPDGATPEQLQRAATPYTVTEQNFTIKCLQHRGPNLHAAFYTHPRESVSFHYKRGVDDPRIGHDVVLEVDDYGNVTRSVSIAYPRRTGYSPPEPALSAPTPQMLAYDQTRLHIRGAEHDYTNPINQPDPNQPNAFLDDYRTPLLASSLAAEITGVDAFNKPKNSGTPAITNLYSYDEIDGTNGLWPTVWDPACDIPYEQIPGSDVDGTGTPATTPTRRALIQHTISYRSDDLTALLPAGQMQPRALPGQSYTAAVTPGQLSAIFGTLVTAATLTEGGYLQLPGKTPGGSPPAASTTPPATATPPQQNSRMPWPTSSRRTALSTPSAPPPASTTTTRTPCW